MRARKICFFIFLSSLAIMGCSPWTDRVTLVNRANKEIKSVSVAIHDRAMEFGPLAPNQKVSMTFIEARGEDYHVTVRFADGKRLEGEVGYITSDISSADTIELYGDKIQLDGYKPFSFGKS
jgi:hypothetical protein